MVSNYKYLFKIFSRYSCLPEQEPGSSSGDAYTTEWLKGVEMPVAWKRRIGKGKIFYISLGHFAHELNHPQMNKIYKYGLLWES